MRVAGVVGILLLAILVPARHFAFNTDASVLGLTVIAVGLLALAGGLVFDMKGGFCTAVCPVLPIERLYGQRPLVAMPSARCMPCRICTKAGCLDLNPERSAVLALRSARGSEHWMTTPYGAFALAFPGFVVTYYLLVDVPLAEATSIMAEVAQRRFPNRRRRGRARRPGGSAVRRRDPGERPSHLSGFVSSVAGRREKPHLPNRQMGSSRPG